VALIAEIKPASPSRGIIREGLNAREMALSYAAAGADCLSVLTDTPFFQGSEQNLRDAREACLLPILRKDFTVCEADVYAARAMGADAVLLIVYGLSDAELQGFREVAEGLGMDALVEVHSEAEAERAVRSGASLIGVNNRDLTTFKTSVEVGLRVLPGLAGCGTLVSESALQSQEDVARVQQAGARAVLIGTAFCAAPDAEAKVREVMGW
jgi:indole-3-glycerol phosphate synthase